MFSSFHPQFRNQYDNDVTVWSPQVRRCLLYHFRLSPRPQSASLTGLVAICKAYYFLFTLIQGRIHQIEYAMEAVKQGSATVGLKSRSHAVLVALKVHTHRESWIFLLHKLCKACKHPLSNTLMHQLPLWAIHTSDITTPARLHVMFLQRAQSELAAHQKKILHVDNHIGISIAGLTADARLLW